MFSISKILSGGAKLLTSGPMEPLASIAATPVFFDLKAKDAEGKSVVQERLLNEKRGFWRTIIESFSWGDIASIVGVIGWVISGRFLRGDVAEDGKPGAKSFVKLWATKIFGLLALGGVTVARLAQKKGLHIKKALGPREYRKQFMEAVEKKTGNPVFKELSFDRLEEEFQRSPMEYPEDEASRVLNLHEQDKFKRFFTGDPGVGKSAGARLVAYNYIKRKKEEGKDNVVVKQLEFKNLLRYLEMESKDMEAASTFFGMFGDKAKDAADSVKKTVQVDPIELMDLALKRVQDEIEEAKENGKDLVLILDEIDAIFQMDKIKERNYDPETLRLLAESFKDLVDPNKYIINDAVGEKIICTSNMDLDFFSSLPIHKEVLESITGEDGRLRVIMRYLSRPDPATQARILAGYLLARYPNPEDVFEKEMVDAIAGKTGRQRLLALADVIHRKVTSDTKFRGLAGRSISGAVEEIEINYKGQKRRADDPNTVRIDADMMKQGLSAIKRKDTRGFKGDEVAQEIVERLVDPQGPYFKRLATNYIESSENMENATLSNVLERLFKGIYRARQTVEGNYYFEPVEEDVSKLPVIDGKHYLHSFRLVKPDSEVNNLNKWIVETCFRPVSQVELTEKLNVQWLLQNADYERSTPVSGATFYEIIANRIGFAIEQMSEGGKKQEADGINLMDLAKSVLGTARNLGLDPRKVLGGFIKP